MNKQAAALVALGTVVSTALVGAPATASQSGINPSTDTLVRTTTCTSNSSMCNRDEAYAVDSINTLYYYNEVWYTFAQIYPFVLTGGYYYSGIGIQCSSGDNPGTQWRGPFTQVNALPPAGGQFVEVCNTNDPSDTLTYSYAGGWIFN